METTLLIAKTTVVYGGSIAAPTVLNGASNPSILAVGALAYYDSSFALISSAAAAANLLDEKQVHLAVGRLKVGSTTLGSPIISPPIHRKSTLLDWRAYDYVAPVKQVTTVTCVANTVQTARDVYEVVVIFTTRGSLPDDRFSVSVTGLQATNDALAVALRAAINARTDLNVTASGATNALILTADNFGEHFKVALREGMENDTIAYTTPFNPGVGTPSSLTIIESGLSTLRGNTNQVRLASKYFSESSLVDDTVDYDTYYLRHTNSHGRKDGMDAVFARDHEMIVAMPDGATQQAVFETVSTLVYGPSATSAPEGGADSAT